jgi:hypothetical protein
METAVEFNPPFALGYRGLRGYKFGIRIGFSFCLTDRGTVSIASNGDFASSNLRVSILPGRAIDQVVSCWLPTAATWVRARVWQVGFMVEKVALEQVFSEYFGFPCQSLFQQILHHHNHLGQVQ